MVSRAMELCFQARLFEPLRKIVEDIVHKAELKAASQKGDGPSSEGDVDADPELLARCAEFFIQHEQHDKAVQLLCLSNQLEKAVDMCYAHNVKLTEELAEKLTPEKTDTNGDFRAEILKKIGKLAKDQGMFQVGDFS